jgi:hypothetical protein
LTIFHAFFSPMLDCYGPSPICNNSFPGFDPHRSGSRVALCTPRSMLLNLLRRCAGVVKVSAEECKGGSWRSLSGGVIQVSGFPPRVNEEPGECPFHFALLPDVNLRRFTSLALGVLISSVQLRSTLRKRGPSESGLVAALVCIDVHVSP